MDRIDSTAALVKIIILTAFMILPGSSMEGRKGHNSVLLFKLQFKHLYICIYYFCYFYYSYLYHFTTLNSRLISPFQFLLQNFTILTLAILYFHLSFIILTVTILMLSL